jgi:hypothetical protein
MACDIRTGSAVRLSDTGKVVGVVSNPDGRSFAVDVSGTTFSVPTSAIQRFDDSTVILDPERLSAELLEAWQRLL